MPAHVFLALNFKFEPKVPGINSPAPHHVTKPARFKPSIQSEVREKQHAAQPLLNAGFKGQGWGQGADRSLPMLHLL